MPFYEITFIVRQDISTKDVETLADSYVNIVLEKGGNLIKREYWGLRDLEYVINKNSKGHYVYLGFQSPYDAVKEIEKKIKLNQAVLRHLTIKLKHLDNEPTPMIRKNIEEQ